MSQAYNCDRAAMKAAMRDMKGLLAALENRRPSTDKEVEDGLRKLGHNPKTVTVKGFCTCIYNKFYREHHIPKCDRDPNHNCKLDTVFGQACACIGLITDTETLDYLWSRSGTMVHVNCQPVLLREIVEYLNKRDADRKIRRTIQVENNAAKKARRKTARGPTSSTRITIQMGDLSVEFASENAYLVALNDVRYLHFLSASTADGILLELLNMPDSHPAKRAFFRMG